MADRAENVSEMLLDGRMSCEICPTLTDLVRKVKENEMSKSDFVNIIRSNIEYQNNKVLNVV
jgi:hypothetical protein